MSFFRLYTLIFTVFCFAHLAGGFGSQNRKHPIYYLCLKLKCMTFFVVSKLKKEVKDEVFLSAEPLLKTCHETANDGAEMFDPVESKKICFEGEMKF